MLGVVKFGPISGWIILAHIPYTAGFARGIALGSEVLAHAQRAERRPGRCKLDVVLTGHVGGKPPHHLFFVSSNLDVQVPALLLQSPQGVPVEDCRPAGPGVSCTAPGVLLIIPLAADAALESMSTPAWAAVAPSLAWAGCTAPRRLLMQV